MPRRKCDNKLLQQKTFTGWASITTTITTSDRHSSQVEADVAGIRSAWFCCLCKPLSRLTVCFIHFQCVLIIFIRNIVTQTVSCRRQVKEPTKQNQLKKAGKEINQHIGKVSHPIKI